MAGINATTKNAAIRPNRRGISAFVILSILMPVRDEPTNRLIATGGVTNAIARAKSRMIPK